LSFVALAQTNSGLEKVEVRGRVVCLTEDMDRLIAQVVPIRHEHVWGVVGSDERFYLLIRSRYSEAIFLDERLRKKPLLLKGHAPAPGGVLEVTTIRSIRDGVVQDLYYYCDVCAIKSVSPEICACCRAPVELIEKPLTESED
jgi:hypothetical protein